MTDPHVDKRTLVRLLHDLDVAGDWHDDVSAPGTTSPSGGLMDATGWDERYAASDLVWSTGPNRTVVDEVGGLAAGAALDLGAGEGRNALWLAEQGWTVTAVDFSAVGLDKAQAIARKRGLQLTTVVADVSRYHPAQTYNLVLIAYLQLPRTDLQKVLATAAAALAPKGTLLLISHDLTNLADGVGGPQDPAVLQTPDQVVAALPRLRIQKAERVRRPVEIDGTTRHAIDTLVRATRLGTDHRCKATAMPMAFAGSLIRTGAVEGRTRRPLGMEQSHEWSLPPERGCSWAHVGKCHCLTWHQLKEG